MAPVTLRALAVVVLHLLLLLLPTALADPDPDPDPLAPSTSLLNVLAPSSTSLLLNAPSSLLNATAEVFVPMRDGALLWTLVFLPEGASASAPVGTVLERTPYRTWYGAAKARVWNARGFAFVLQDLRGSGSSRATSSAFTFWRSDGPDGYDAIAWVAAQAWSDQRVYVEGVSAMGIAIFASLHAQPPWLRAIAPSLATADGHASVYQGGAFRQALFGVWLPLMRFGDLVDEIYTHEAPDDPWWEPITLAGKEDRCTYPGVHHSGWYDLYLTDSIHAFEQLQFGATDLRCRGQHRMVIEAGGHCAQGAYPWADPVSGIYGDIMHYLFLREGGRAIPPALERRVAEADTYTFYVLGPENATYGQYWTTLPAWPAAEPTRFFLAPNGRLDSTAPDAPPLTYSYDPADPTPTAGGPELFLPCGPRDQSAIEARSDVLVFTAAPFAAPTAVVGHMSAALWVATDRNDTDVAVRVTDVYPDGRSFLLVDGIVRLRWRLGGAAPSLPVPGEVYAVEVDLWRTAYIFEPGHALRVIVASANHPRFQRNPNNGAPIGRLGEGEGELLIARNTVYMDATRPSSVTLPIVPLASIPRNFQA